MGKESQEKSRNERKNAPYHASNSSFAKRFTSKLAEYVPFNWASGWIDNNEDQAEGTSTSNPSSIQVEAEINQYENASSIPKKSSIPDHNNLASDANNRTTCASSALGNETCPILNSKRHFGDNESAETSGHRKPNKPQNLIGASTPAFNVSKPSGDYLSPVVQLDKLGAETDMAKSKSFCPRHFTTDEITKSHNRIGGPQFDTSLFNSSSRSTNKSVNLSPFYPGRTMCQGASTYRKCSMGLNKSSTFPSMFQPSLCRASLCNEFKVNPSPIILPQLSVVAEELLKTINTMTPATTMMTKSVNNTPASLKGARFGIGVKRNIKELQIFTLVNTDLIQLKRSERKNALSQRIQSALSTCGSSSDEDDYSIVSNDSKQSPTTLPKMSAVAEKILKTTKPITTMMTGPILEEVNNTPSSLRGAGFGNGDNRNIELRISTGVNVDLIQVEESERKNALSKRIQSALSSCSCSSDEDDYSIVSNAKRSLSRRNNEEVQTDVNLPNVVPSLPIIDIPLAKPSIDVSFSDPIDCRNFNITSETYSLLSMSNKLIAETVM